MLKERDENAHFFHGVALERQFSSEIFISGRLEEYILSISVNFYKVLYNEKDMISLSIYNLEFAKIGEEQVDWL